MAAGKVKVLMIYCKINMILCQQEESTHQGTTEGVLLVLWCVGDDIVGRCVWGLYKDVK